jgi:hypothetical protein
LKHRLGAYLLQGLTRGIQALKHLPRLAVLLLNENELKAVTMRAVANLTSLTVRCWHPSRRSCSPHAFVITGM